MKVGLFGSAPGVVHGRSTLMSEVIFFNLKKYQLKLIRQSLQMSYDKDGHRYDLPVFVINPPIKYTDTGATSNFRIKNIKVFLDFGKMT